MKQIKSKKQNSKFKMQKSKAKATKIPPILNPMKKISVLCHRTKTALRSQVKSSQVKVKIKVKVKSRTVTKKPKLTMA
jgi:hypothetical protein